MSSKRNDSDEKYVLDLFEELIGEKYYWQMKFETLLGDPGKRGRRRKLPVDGYFSNANLIVEYREKQHFQSVEIMDKRMTISGVPRGEQRKIYDFRKEKWASDNNVKFIIIKYNELAYQKNGKLKRDKNFDKVIINKILENNRIY